MNSIIHSIQTMMTLYDRFFESESGFRGTNGIDLLQSLKVFYYESESGFWQVECPLRVNYRLDTLSLRSQTTLTNLQHESKSFIGFNSSLSITRHPSNS